MKSVIFYLSCLLCLIFVACETNDSVVGSSDDTQIPNLSFTVDTTYLDAPGGKLVAKGTVKNNGNS